MKRVLHSIGLLFVLFLILFIFCGGFNLVANLILNWLGW